MGAENPRVLSQEAFDELNTKLELMTFERDSTETLLSDVRDELTNERSENKKLRSELSKALIKLMTIEAVLSAEDFKVVEKDSEEQEEFVGTDDIINGLTDLSGLPEVEDLSLNTPWYGDEADSR